MWELDYKESWVPKNWCFWTVVLEKTLASPLDYKEIQPVHPKGNQSWIFTGRTDAEAETPILWPPDAKNWLTWKDPDAGKDWRWEEKGTTVDQKAGWHHWLDGHEFEQAPGAGDRQESLACYSPWGHKESDTTEWLNWTELSWTVAGLERRSVHSNYSNLGWIKKISEWSECWWVPPWQNSRGEVLIPSAAVLEDGASGSPNWQNECPYSGELTSTSTQIPALAPPQGMHKNDVN